MFLEEVNCMDKEKLEKEIRLKLRNNKLSCKNAHKIAAETGCRLSEIGDLCNQLEIKIVGCQLGCF